MKRPAMDSPARPRRGLTRKTIVLEEDSEDELSRIQEDRDEEFTPAPPKSTRKLGRRKTTAATEESPQKQVRTKKARSGDNVDTTTVDPSEETILPPTPVKSAVSPRKRRSVAPRPTRDASVPPPTPVLPTPAPSESPEQVVETKSRPLADITSKALNRKPDVQPKEKIGPKVQVEEVQLERPYDIALRAKAHAAAVATVAELDTAPKSRMVIRQLVMTNFKSYAGRQVVGPFHHSFSSVVGPNGSGKSNVIDSLLFVFGFRASKMRQGKISALIHNSAQFQDLEFCEVEV